MTVTQFVLGKYTGLSTDIKPKGDADPDLVTEFTEMDTGNRYVLTADNQWDYSGTDGGGTRGQSGIISEYGDAITDSEPLHYYRFDGVDTDINGQNSASFSGKYYKSEKGRLRGHTAAFLGGTDSASVPDSGTLSTDSFLRAIWFRPTQIGVSGTIFHYAASATSEIRLYVSASGTISCDVRRGGVSRTLSLAHAVTTQWHLGVIYYDNDSNTLLLAVSDGSVITDLATDSVTLPTAPAAAADTRIGASYDTVTKALSNHFVGDVAHYANYRNPDHNLIRYVLSGAIGPASVNATVTLVNDSTLSHNGGYFRIERTDPSIAECYVNTVQNLGAGRYDITVTQHRDTDGMNYDMIINGIRYVNGKTQYNATPVYNESVILRDKGIPGGVTVTRISANGKHASSTGKYLKFPEIRYYQRDGTNDSGEFCIRGDDFDILSDTLVTSVFPTRPYNVASHVANPAVGSRLGASFVATRGGYHIAVQYDAGPNMGNFDIYVNGHRSYSATGYYATNSLNTVTFFAPLNAGINTIETVVTGKHGTSTGYRVQVHHITGKIKLGDGSRTSRVDLMEEDSDWQVAAGTPSEAYGARRHARNITLKSNDSVLFHRHFAGGLYLLDVSTLGTTEVMLDDAKIGDISGRHREIMRIAPGYHDITYRNNGTANTSALASFFALIAPIREYDILTASSAAEPAEQAGHLVPIGKAYLPKDDVLMDMEIRHGYGDVLIEVDGSATGTSTQYIHIRGRFDGKTANYAYQGLLESSLVWATRRTPSTSYVELVEYRAIANGNKKYMLSIDGSVRKTATGHVLFGRARAHTNSPGWQESAFRVGVDGTALEKITIFKGSTASLGRGTEIRVYGRNRIIT